MSEHPLKIFEKLDPDLLELVKRTNDLALDDGALPKKVKLLVAMALDASHGAVQGVRSLAQAAMQAGSHRKRDYRSASERVKNSVQRAEGAFFSDD